MKPYFEEDGITIYHADCRDVSREAIGVCHGVLTDPPYGIDLDIQRYAGARVNGRRIGAKYEQFKNETDAIDYDFLWKIGLVQIVFGANNWPQQLPFDCKKDGWICWDKRCDEQADKVLGSPFELAAVIGRRYYKIFRLQHAGAINADGANIPRYHPTQKPVRLMQRIIKQFFPKQIVCDPFMGSGSTLLGAKALGQQAVGIEIEERYCEIAANRLSQKVLNFEGK